MEGCAGSTVVIGVAVPAVEICQDYIRRSIWRFAARAGQWYRFTTDPSRNVQIGDRYGQRIASINNDGSWQAPADGTYYVQSFITPPATLLVTEIPAP